jgi:endonuclease YncB( thermonuclease family)
MSSGCRRQILARAACAFVLGFAAAISVAPATRAADAPTGNAPVTGTALAIDASHVSIEGQRFKLFGIDAPDVDETCNDAKGIAYPCGVEARAALAALVADKSVTCRPRGPNQFDETLARCVTGPFDLANAQAEAGWAIADRTRSLDYEPPELAAREAKRGIWQGRFVPPVDWRAGERVPPVRQSPKVGP